MGMLGNPACPRIVGTGIHYSQVIVEEHPLDARIHRPRRIVPIYEASDNRIVIAQATYRARCNHAMPCLHSRVAHEGSQQLNDRYILGRTIGSSDWPLVTVALYGYLITRHCPHRHAQPGLLPADGAIGKVKMIAEKALRGSHVIRFRYPVV